MCRQPRIPALELPGAANTINHLFGKSAHNLQGLVTQFGSREAAYTALYDATNAMVGAQGTTGLFQSSVNVAGRSVTVRGNVIDGVLRINTAFIPWAGAMNMLNELEAAVLDKLLAGDLPSLACLRTQRQRMHVTKREHTGVGFFTEFGHPDDVARLATSKSIRFGDVLAELDGLEHGAGFLLFIDNGLITMLEGYTNANEAWPDKLERFELRYWTPQRDLTPFQDASDQRGSEPHGNRSR